MNLRRWLTRDQGNADAMMIWLWFCSANDNERV